MTPARAALERLMADHRWHPWWQIMQVAGVFIDPRIAGRRYIRLRDSHLRREGKGRSGLTCYQDDPEAAERVGKGEVIRVMLQQMGAVRRGRYGAPEYRLPRPSKAAALRPVGGKITAKEARNPHPKLAVIRPRGVAIPDWWPRAKDGAPSRPAANPSARTTVRLWIAKGIRREYGEAIKAEIDAAIAEGAWP